MNADGERAREESWALVAVMVGVGALGTGLGYSLDWLLGTTPWILLAGAVAGLGGGLFLLLRAALGYARREKVRRRGGTEAGTPTKGSAPDVAPPLKASRP